MSTMITGEAKKSFKAIVVKELPEKGILNNLYFVLNGDEGDNKYDEYIWIKDPDTQQYMWEKVGYSYVDLAPYYTKEEVDGKLSPITAHITNYDNPHQVTKDQVGLGNVDNTSDLDKPLSNNDKQALNLKIGSISIESNAGGGLKLGLWGAKADEIVVGGQSINKVDLGTVVIPNVTADQDGLFPASWFNIFKDNTLRSTGISYGLDFIDLGTINNKSAHLNAVTSEYAGILSADQYKVLLTAGEWAAASISSIVPTPSSDRIILKLKKNIGNASSDMSLGLVNTTNAGLMSPTDKSKLDGIESLASSDITALFS